MSLFNKPLFPEKDLCVSDKEFTELRDFIYRHSGIYIADNRRYLIENRLSGRLKQLGLKTYGDYFHYLQFGQDRREELNRLFEAVTTNETSFYRNPPQLKVFEDTVLPEVLATQRKSGNRSLRIWSAGCSTGEEPYTLAIILHEVLKGEIGAWNIRINAGDLSEAVLHQARQAQYTDYALRTTPKPIVDRYFTQDGGKYQLKDQVRKLVNFFQMNLADRDGLRKVDRSQIVFCRNVIIYFDDDMKKRVISSFYDNLYPGGYLFIGHSESLHNISRAFSPVHHTGAITYRKEV